MKLEPHPKGGFAGGSGPLHISFLYHSNYGEKEGKAMPLMEISIVPVGTKTSSFSDAVKEVCRIIEQRGLNYQVTPTAAVIEGSIDQLMNVAAEIHQTSLNNGADRVITHITIDDRLDQPMDLHSQVAKIQPPSMQ